MSRFIRWRMTDPDAYQRHLEDRKKRYAEDEEFRESQLRYNAAWREKKKKKNSKKPAVKRPRKPRTLDVNGKKVEFWSVGRMANTLGVCNRTITNLEKVGSIPINHLLDKRRRWWPADFVLWLKPFFEARQNGISAQEFHRRVWTGWTEAQIAGVVTALSPERSELDGELENHTQERTGEPS
jgi:hypothetical protein